MVQAFHETLTGAAVMMFSGAIGAFAGTAFRGSMAGKLLLAGATGYGACNLGNSFINDIKRIINHFKYGEPLNPSDMVRRYGTLAVAAIAHWVKDPVDVLTGVMGVKAVDFELPGPIPLIWGRTWYSDSQLIGQLGHSMRHSFEMGLDIYEKERVLAVYLDDGTEVIFPYLLVGEEYFDHRAKRLLKREADHYCCQPLSMTFT